MSLQSKSAFVTTATRARVSGGGGRLVLTKRSCRPAHDRSVRGEGDRVLTRGQRAVRLRLPDFSQSRLLINFQIVSVKVTGVFSTAVQIKQPHPHPPPSTFLSESAGRADTRSVAFFQALQLLLPRQFQLREGVGCPPGGHRRRRERQCDVPARSLLSVRDVFLSTSSPAVVLRQSALQ